MGADVARDIGRRRRPDRLGPLPQVATAQPEISQNALIGIGMWALLWAGYFAEPELLFSPGFPRNTADFIQCIRDYLPMLGGWFALILILTRLRRLGPWLAGPLGWVFFYAIVGLASSLFVSIEAGDATYYGSAYMSVVLILLAIVLVPNPLADLRHVMTFTWIVSVVLTLGLLGIIPGLGRGALTGYQAGGPLGRTTASGEILGMASRNTGFARYAAVSAIVALARVWEGKIIVRLIWAGVFGVSFYSLVIANGRTEVLAFVASAFLVMYVHRARRTFFMIAGVAATSLLGLMGFFNSFFLYITRTGRIDLTMTGRTRIWEEGWALFLKSPWWGFGFQADRYYLEGQHMHDAFLHALVQSGVLGAGALFLALVVVWVLTIKHFILWQPADKLLISSEIPGVLMFITLSSATESTFAYYSAAWLLSAPIFAYVLALNKQLQRSRRMALPQRLARGGSARNRLRDMDSDTTVKEIPLTSSGDIPNS
jgi:O-antigen ligase